MKYLAKANTSKPYRRLNSLIIGFVALLSCFGIAMLVYEFVTGKVLLGISFAIASFLGITYVIIRINTVFATYLALDPKNLCLKNWANDFLPYDAESRIKVINEFVPAPTKLTMVPINEISEIIIGTKNFVKRSVNPASDFAKAVSAIDRSGDKYMKKTVSGMDILCVITRDGSSCYMPIEKFDPRAVSKVIQGIKKRNDTVELKINSRDYRMLRREI